MSRAPLLLALVLLLPASTLAAEAPTPALEVQDGPLHEWTSIQVHVRGAGAPHLETIPLSPGHPAPHGGARLLTGIHIHTPGVGWNEIHMPDVPEDAALEVSATHSARDERALIQGIRRAGPTGAVAEALLTAPGEWEVRISVDGTPHTVRIDVPHSTHRGFRLEGTPPAVVAWTEPPGWVGLAPLALQAYILHNGTPAPIDPAHADVDLATWPEIRTVFSSPGPTRWHELIWDDTSRAYRGFVAMDPGVWYLVVHVRTPEASAGGNEVFWVDGRPPLPVPPPTRQTPDKATYNLTFNQPGPWTLLVHDPVTGLHEEHTLNVTAARPTATAHPIQKTPLTDDFWGRAATEARIREPHYEVVYAVQLHHPDGTPAPGVEDAILDLPELHRTLTLEASPDGGYLAQAILPDGQHLARVLAPSLGLDIANATWFTVGTRTPPSDAPGEFGVIMADEDRQSASEAKRIALQQEHAAFAFAIAGGMVAGLLIVLRRR